MWGKQGQQLILSSVRIWLHINERLCETWLHFKLHRYLELQWTLVIVNAWIVDNLSLVNIFGETGRLFYNINYMLNSKHLISKQNWWQNRVYYYQSPLYLGCITLSEVRKCPPNRCIMNQTAAEHKSIPIITMKMTKNWRVLGCN